MKLDKNQQKQLMDAIRKSTKEKGFKICSNSIYRKIGDAFVFCNFLFVESRKLVYRILIKNYEYDDIFWEIMNMPENSKEPCSLRAVGAFAAPSVTIKKGEAELTEDFKAQAEFLVSLVDECSDSFLKHNDIDEYVINCSDILDINILKCLAYLHMNKKDEARMIAEKALSEGDKGRFSSGGKYFFEWAILML